MLQGNASGTKSTASGTKGKRKSNAAAIDEEEMEVVGMGEMQQEGTPEKPLVLDDTPSEPAAAAASPPMPIADDSAQDRIASANAYMLVYRRRGWHSGAESKQIRLPAK